MKLKDLVVIKTGYSIRGGLTPIPEENTNEWDLKLLQMKNVDPEYGINLSALTCIKFQAKKDPEYLVKGDIVFVNRGTRLFAVCIDQDLPNVAAAPHFLVLKVKNESISPEYVAWYLNHKKAQAYYAKEAAGTAVTHLSKVSLENLSIEVPPREKQDQIVKVNNLYRREKIITGKLLEKKSLLIEQMLTNVLEG